MKKNLSLAVLLIIGLLAFTSSCVKDKFTEQDAYAQQRQSELLKDSLAKAQAKATANLTKQQILLLDSLKKVGGVVNYSVDVVVASKSSWWSNYFSYMSKGEKGEMGLDGAVVTLSQYGKVYAVTTTANGIASFSDLRIGTANVNISKTGYTEVDYVVDLPPLTSGTHTSTYNNETGSSTVSDTVTRNIVDLVRNGATMVPVFSLTANLSTVSGKATVETDLTNDAPEVAAGVKIMGIIDVNSSDFWQLYMYQPELYDYWHGPTGTVPKFDYYGKIKQIAFGSTISTATTAADGTFTMQVPSTPQGLPIHFEVDQFALNQSLLMPAIYGVPVWGVQSVRTMFGPNISYSQIPNLGTGNIMNVQSAYVQFSAPTGSPAALPTTPAVAAAVLTNSGIISVNITNPGQGYTQPPLVKFAAGTAFNSVQAEGTAVITGGKVTSVSITAAGSGYKPGDTPAVTFVEDLAFAATATPKIGFSISAIGLTLAGTGYTSAPAVTITSLTGTGAAATANMTGYVSALTLTNAGAGYTATPTVTIAAGTGVLATATATMTTFNPVLSVTAPTAATYTLKRLGTHITGVGSGALTDSTIISTSGRLFSITITSGGTGYLTAPAVTISGGGGSGAVAHTSINVGGVVNGIVVDVYGSGYTSNPTITIDPPTAGTTATGAPVRDFRITGINVLAGGNGYVAASTAVQFETFAGSGVYVAAPAGVTAVLSQSIASLAIGVNGDGYSAAPTVTITPTNAVVPTTAATASSAILYKVKDITVTAQGSGYEGTDVLVTLAAPPSGTTATAGTISRINGLLKRVILTNPGSGYTAAPNVYLTVSGAPGVIPVHQAEMTATVSGGQVTAITIADPGQGYDYTSDAAGNYTATISTYKSGVGAAATANPNPKSGQIDFITISNPGAGYSGAPKIEIFNDTQGDANGFGTGAVATAVVTDGRVSAINLTNAGSGYYVAPNVRIVVVSSVMKAMGRCIVSADGRITGVDFSNPGGGWPGYQFTSGFGYDTAPTVTFTPSVPGKGTGAVGIATINNGSVSSVIMNNQGSGYTGRNKPLLMGLSINPSSSISATAGKSYVMDFYFGTGMHTVTELGIF